MCYALIIIKFYEYFCKKNKNKNFIKKIKLLNSSEDIGIILRIKIKNEYFKGKIIGFDDEENEYIIKFKGQIFKSKIKDHIVNERNELDIEYKEEEIEQIKNNIMISKPKADKLLNSKEDIGLRVKIYWQVPYGRLRHGNIEKYDRWYSGTISEYNEKNKKHTIHYDDGDIRKYLLQYKEFIIID